VRRLWGGLRAWWRTGPDRPAPAFAVACRCGHVLRGLRQARAQVLPCPVCGRNLFVLPASPYLTVRDESPPPSSPRLARPSWRGPLRAAGLTLFVVLLLFAFGWGLLRRGRPSDSPSSGAEVAAPDTTAPQDLAEGRFHRAAEAARAVLQGARAPGSRGEAEQRRLLQTWREADLYDRLLPIPLEELLAAALNEPVQEQWEASFQRNGAGRTVIFDDIVRRDVHNRPILACYLVETGGARLRVALEDLDLFRHLPAEPARRVLFGARLASLRREADGWVVRFEPDSGVLLTDPDALNACCPGLVDPEVREALLRQQNWLPRVPLAAPR
jgi:hypothetical protein